MTIPIEVSYVTTGSKKTRNVTAVICPTVLNQTIGYFKAQPIYVELGDIEVNWEESTPGFDMMINYGGEDLV